MRKLFVSADMEGCAAVSAQQALMPDRWAWEWNAVRRWMTGEVAVAAEAALAAGYDEVIVADGHGNAHNIDPDGLPENVRLVRSWPRPHMQMQGVAEAGVQACAFIGYHAAAGAQDGILAHTYSGAALRAVRLNGEVCSEGYLNAAFAGEFGKPVLFVAGDQHVVEDAQRYAPEAVMFVTKQSFGWRSQMSLPPAQVQRLLKEAFGRALGRALPAPFRVPGPYLLELEMTSQPAAEMLSYLPGVERQGAFGVSATFDRIASLMSFLSFVILYSPTGVPAI